MPRKRVKPEDRQRSVIACVPCKKAKIRCDAGSPCSTCSKRGRDASCVYHDAYNPGERQLSLVEKSPQPAPPDSSRGAESSSDSTVCETIAENGPQSRMLLSSKLQKGKYSSELLLLVRTRI